LKNFEFVAEKVWTSASAEPLSSYRIPPLLNPYCLRRLRDSPPDTHCMTVWPPTPDIRVGFPLWIHDIPYTPLLVIISRTNILSLHYHRSKQTKFSLFSFFSYKWKKP